MLLENQFSQLYVVLTYKFIVELTMNVNCVALLNVGINLEMVDDVAKRMYPAVFPREKYKKDATARENVTLLCDFNFNVFVISLKLFGCLP